MVNETTLGLIAGALTSIAFVPQVIKVLKTKNTDDLSSLMLIILIAGLSLWVYYGFMKNELPIIISNAFAAVLNLILLSCKLLLKN